MRTKVKGRKGWWNLIHSNTWQRNKEGKCHRELCGECQHSAVAGGGGAHCTQVPNLE